MVTKGLNGRAIITEGWSVIEYLVRQFPENISETFLQPEKKELTMRNYFYQEFRPNSCKIVRKAGNKVLNPSKQAANDKWDIVDAKTEKIFESLNKQLQSSNYLLGDKVSLVDVLFFCEIYQISQHTKPVNNRFANLCTWMEQMKKIDAVREVHERFDQDVVDKYNLKLDIDANQ